MLSKDSTAEELEFKIIHSTQIEAEKFFDLIDNSNIILLEETSLLILNELNLLDDFLKLLPSFSIVDSVFKKINLTTHEPVSINSQISGAILKAIQNNIEKLQLINDSKENVFKYDLALKGESGLLLTDDLYLSNLIQQENPNIAFGNIFNILEFLYTKGLLNEDKFHEKIVSCYDLGMVDINMRSDFLGKSINYNLGRPDVFNYEDTGFKPIFDKLIAERNDFRAKYKLFLDMFNYVNVYALNTHTLISLISKLLEYNPTYDPQSIINTWLINSGLKRKILSGDTLISRAHADLWFKYKEVMEDLSSTTYPFEFLLGEILKIISTLDESVSRLAFKNLKVSFAADSQEYRYLQTFDLNF
ncbi:hypothetical protein HLH17_13935 [Acinetobacter sp. ANC 5380]|uniref:Uncharacterized protein n=1 Tax=Acinetobacter terrae TaxID=2731247 RepID=A0A7Y2RHQ8_9GAMM|nr:hypothetical protein [Acinetobacter terrae]NNH78729.1 hypothetical protein [Acinetobacter terrae]